MHMCLASTMRAGTSPAPTVAQAGGGRPGLCVIPLRRQALSLRHSRQRSRVNGVNWDELFQYSQSVNANLHANRHTSMGHVPGHHDRYCKLVCHTCGTETGK